MPQLTLFVHRTQELTDRLDYDEDEDLITHQINAREMMLHIPIF
jgi:hypothetical protein